MALKCGICNNNVAEGVCHHCGRPLCNDERCCFSVSKDRVFSTKTTAFHCRACFQKYHPSGKTEDQRSSL